MRNTVWRLAQPQPLARPRSTRMWPRPHPQLARRRLRAAADSRTAAAVGIRKGAAVATAATITTRSSASVFPYLTGACPCLAGFGSMGLPLPSVPRIGMYITDGRCVVDCG